ncbi:hypothetical protein [Sulfurospirillum sp. MES]|uniref:hypothetical protein n=1 Tax=Sulfurospirillum sp. MES TaxID=1565314 RepID=UPI000543BFC8|nr:hypothetical protein [Sulfurospirillum sp. MES]KHG33891.1 MAG: hypothetical protein OA34_05950 [Sulfurospirillum sp. MES]
MDFFINTLIVALAAFSLIVILRPKKAPKSKEQKQAELKAYYTQKLVAELEQIDDAALRQEKKIALLKTFAKELKMNLFFDEEEVKALIEELAGY